MTSQAIRDPKFDNLLTPENSAFVLIDYQPIQVSSIRSISQDELVFNIVGCAKAAVSYPVDAVGGTSVAAHEAALLMYSSATGIATTR